MFLQAALNKPPNFWACGGIKAMRAGVHLHTQTHTHRHTHKKINI